MSDLLTTFLSVWLGFRVAIPLTTQNPIRACERAPRRAVLERVVVGLVFSHHAGEAQVLRVPLHVLVVRRLHADAHVVQRSVGADQGRCEGFGRIVAVVALKLQRRAVRVAHKHGQRAARAAERYTEAGQKCLWGMKWWIRMRGGDLRARESDSSLEAARAFTPGTLGTVHDACVWPGYLVVALSISTAGHASTQPHNGPQMQRGNERVTEWHAKEAGAGVAAEKGTSSSSCQPTHRSWARPRPWRSPG